MSEWAVTIPRDLVDRLLTAERIWDAQAAVVDDHIWIRGGKLDDALQRELVTLSDKGLWLISDGQLIPLGGQVPFGRLPDTDWCNLRDLVTLSLPVASIPAGRVARVPLRLRRGGPERAANLQVIDWSAWLAWAGTAEEMRLHHLQFVAVAADEFPVVGAQRQNEKGSRDWRAIVRGEQLPGLPGTLFRLFDNIALPLGYSMEPTLDTATVRLVLEAEHDGESADYLLIPASLESSTSLTVVAIAQDAWLIARLENIRATDESMNENRPE